MSKLAQNSSLVMHVFVLLSSFMSHHRPRAILRMSGYGWQISKLTLFLPLSKVMMICYEHDGLQLTSESDQRQ